MEPTIKDLMKEIKQLRIDVNIIKNNIADNDDTFNDDEHQSINQAMKEYENGETVTLEEIEVSRKNAGLEI